MSQSLSKLLSEIEAARTQANVDLNQFDPKFQAAQAIAKADAGKRLVTLTEQFNEEIKDRAAFMLLNGQSEIQAEFVKVAQEEGGVLTVSARQAYNMMADEVEQTIGAQRQFGGTQLGHLIRAIEAVGKAANSRFLKVPHLEDVVYVKDHDAVTDTCRDIVLKQLGPELNRNFIQEETFRKALDTNYKEKVVPVVITDATPEETEFFMDNLFYGVGIRVDLRDAKVDKDLVLEQFKTLKQTIKSR